MEQQKKEPKKGSKLQKLVSIISKNFSKKKKNSNNKLSKVTSVSTLQPKTNINDKHYPELPKNFAENLLNLELEVEELYPPPISSLKQLLELYIIGVEYYEAMHSQRYLIFKNKINLLMMKPKIVELLNQNESTEKIEKSIDSERALLSKQEKKKMLDLHIFMTSKQSEETLEDKAKTLMNRQENYAKNLNEIIKNEIQNQQKSILNRLEDRKRAVSFIESGSSPNHHIEIEQTEEFKKNSLSLLKKKSKEIGNMVTKINLRNSLKSTKSKKDIDEKEEIDIVVKRYEEELNHLKSNLKDKKSSLLISKMIEKIEIERDSKVKEIKMKYI